MADLDLVALAGATLKNGVPTMQAGSAVTNETEDVEPFGDIEMVSQLGVSAMPAAANDAGRPQGVIARGIGGANATCVGAIDRRNADIYGKLSPGDTALHSTGPDAVSMVLCKAKKRQTVLAVKGSDDKQILVVLDGKKDTLTITAFGQIIELSRKNGINLTDGGAGIQIKDGVLVLYGQIQFGRTPNAAMALMMGPKSGSPGGAASVPLFPVPGVGVPAG